MRPLVGVLVFAAALVAAACSVAAVPTVAAPASFAPIPLVTPPPPLPSALRIPALDVDTELIVTGVHADDTLQTPPTNRPEVASWFVGSPEPGEVGPSVILGHVNGAGRPGVFLNLATLEPGAEIWVDRQHAAPVRFVVSAVERYAKADFPTARVYGDTDRRELRLITCGGVFDRSAPTKGSPNGSYTDNWVVYAEAVGDTDGR